MLGYRQNQHILALLLLVQLSGGLIGCPASSAVRQDARQESAIDLTSDITSVTDLDDIAATVCQREQISPSHQSVPERGNWTLVLDPAFLRPSPEQAIREATYQQSTLHNELITFEDDQTKVAGFIIAKDAEIDDASFEAQINFHQQQIEQVVASGSPPGQVQLLFTTPVFETHDKFEAITTYRLIDYTEGFTNPFLVQEESTLRDLLAAALAGSGQAKPVAGPDLGQQGWFFLITTIIHRFDAQAATGQHAKPLILINALVPLLSLISGEAHVNSEPFVRLSSLINGSALARADKLVQKECIQRDIDSLPMIDLVWIVTNDQAMQARLANKDSVLSTVLDMTLSLFAKAVIDVRFGVMAATCDPQKAYLVNNSYTRKTDVLQQRMAKLFQYSTATSARDCYAQAPVTAGMNLYQKLDDATFLTDPLHDIEMSLRAGSGIAFVYATDRAEKQFVEASGTVEALPDTAGEKLFAFHRGKKIVTVGLIADTASCCPAQEISTIARQLIKSTGGEYRCICDGEQPDLLQNREFSIMLALASFDVLSRTSPFLLPRRPISSTLRVARQRSAGGPPQLLDYSINQGFSFGITSTPALIFFRSANSPLADTLAQGDRLHISYFHFEDSPIIE